MLSLTTLLTPNRPARFRRVWPVNKGGDFRRPARGVYELKSVRAFRYNTAVPITIYVFYFDLYVIMIIGSGGAPLIKLKVDIDNAAAVRGCGGRFIPEQTGDED